MQMYKTIETIRNKEEPPAVFGASVRYTVVVTIAGSECMENAHGSCIVAERWRPGLTSEVRARMQSDLLALLPDVSEQNPGDVSAFQQAVRQQGNARHPLMTAPLMTVHELAAHGAFHATSLWRSTPQLLDESEESCDEESPMVSMKIPLV